MSGKPFGGLGEIDLLDREQAARRFELAVADTDERAEPEEKVGQLVEVAVEDEADRHDLIVALDRRGLGRDRLELDSGLLRDPRQLEQDARHVGDGRHRLGEPEDVGDRDRLGVGRSNCGGAGGRDGLLGRCRLGLELEASARFGATSMNQKPSV